MFANCGGAIYFLILPDYICLDIHSAYRFYVDINPTSAYKHKHKIADSTNVLPSHSLAF